MALSNTEKQRRYRERQRLKRIEEAKTEDRSFAANVNRTPFFESFIDSGNRSDFDLCFDLMGLDAPDFEDDSGPRSKEGIVDHPEETDDPYSGAVGSLGRAEIMVGCLLDAAVTLAGIVRQHKLDEIEARMKDAEKDLTNDPSSASKIAEHLAQLAKMRTDLQRSIRWNVPNWQTDTDTS